MKENNLSIGWSQYILYNIHILNNNWCNILMHFVLYHISYILLVCWISIYLMITIQNASCDSVSNCNASDVNNSTCWLLLHSIHATFHYYYNIRNTTRTDWCWLLIDDYVVVNWWMVLICWKLKEKRKDDFLVKCFCLSDCSKIYPYNYNLWFSFTIQKLKKSVLADHVTRTILQRTKRTQSW